MERLLPALKDVQLVAQIVWAGVHGVVSLQMAKRNDPWIDWRPLKKTASLAIDTMIRGLQLNAGVSRSPRTPYQEA